MKKLPIGIQTFEKIRQKNYLYIDKTEYVYKLLDGEFYFLSRPRRFGKSVFLSTLEALFLGKKELFEGLYIAQTDYDWPVYPVIRIDFSSVSLDTEELFKTSLKEILFGIAHQYNLELTSITGTPQSYLRELVIKLSEKGKVVILIDEYDQPFTQYIQDPEKSNAFQIILHRFFMMIKSLGEYLCFVFITGVSKFSKTSIFSAMNNLEDISMSSEYAAICGYTEQELIANFAEYIEQAAKSWNLSFLEATQEIRSWYNGYAFTREKVKVYNPTSCLLCLKQKILKNYWFETGTPKFLFELIKEKDLPIQDFDKGSYAIQASFSPCDIDSVEIDQLLYQTGYLTIKEYDPKTGIYLLAYPNREVQESVTNSLALAFIQVTQNKLTTYTLNLQKALEKKSINDFLETMKAIFANIPYGIQECSEKYYQSTFYLICKLLGMQIEAEVMTNRGRIDAVIQTKTDCYIFEFKLRRSRQGTAEEFAQQALQQIYETEYYQKYTHSPKIVHLIGAAFDIDTRNLSAWKIDSLV